MTQATSSKAAQMLHNALKESLDEQIQAVPAPDSLKALYLFRRDLVRERSRRKRRIAYSILKSAAALILLSIIIGGFNYFITPFFRMKSTSPDQDIGHENAVQETAAGVTSAASVASDADTEIEGITDLSGFSAADIQAVPSPSASLEITGPLGADGVLPVSVTNLAEETLSMNTAFRLEALVNGAWTELSIKDRYDTAGENVTLSPGGTFHVGVSLLQYELPDDPTGTYRLTVPAGKEDTAVVFTLQRSYTG